MSACSAASPRHNDVTAIQRANHVVWHLDVSCTNIVFHSLLTWREGRTAQRNDRTETEREYKRWETMVREA
jgi:hypothetical protein